MRGVGRSGGRATLILFGGVFGLAAVALIVFGTVMRNKHTPELGPALLGGPHISAAGGRFAGYRELVDVTSIGASWEMPRLANDSRLGVAATWIGAQGPGGQSTPFIQVGTEENMIPDNDGVLVPMYEAFFSDTARDFRPDGLFVVNPGDQITASMRLRHGHWQLTITDTTTGTGRSLTTSQDGTGPFAFAEWTQEDVTSANTNRAEPYPDLSAVTMTALRVDNRVPPSGQLLSSWMALPGGYLGPTPVRANAFSVVPMKLSQAAAEYLRIVDPEDAASERFDAAAATWRASTPERVVQHDSDALAAGLAHFDAQLLAVRWPASVAGLVRSGVRDIRPQITLLRHAALSGPRAVAMVLGVADDSAQQNDFDLIRRRLGIEQAR